MEEIKVDKKFLEYIGLDRSDTLKVFSETHTSIPKDKENQIISGLKDILRGGPQSMGGCYHKVDFSLYLDEEDGEFLVGAWYQPEMAFGHPSALHNESYYIQRDGSSRFHSATDARPFDI